MEKQTLLLHLKQIELNTEVIENQELIKLQIIYALSEYIGDKDILNAIEEIAFI